MRDPELARARRRSAGHPGAAAASRWRSPLELAAAPRARRSLRARSRARAPPARRCCSGSARRFAPASRSAPWPAIASLAASSSAWIARASASAASALAGPGSASRPPPHAVDGVTRLTAVGRAARAARRRARVPDGVAAELERDPVRRPPRRSAARRGSPGGGSRRRPRRPTAARARSRQGSAVWSSARSVDPPSNRQRHRSGAGRVLSPGGSRSTAAEPARDRGGLGGRPLSAGPSSRPSAS